MVVIDGYGGYVPLYHLDRAEVTDQQGGRAAKLRSPLRTRTT
jgi:3-hydroxy-3-methylglutaryl CoA synthase